MAKERIEVHSGNNIGNDKNQILVTTEKIQSTTESFSSIEDGIHNKKSSEFENNSIIRGLLPLGVISTILGIKTIKDALKEADLNKAGSGVGLLILGAFSFKTTWNAKKAHDLAKTQRLKLEAAR